MTRHLLTWSDSCMDHIWVVLDMWLALECAVIHNGWLSFNLGDLIIQTECLKE